MNKKSRRQRNFEQNRQDIINAALEVFINKGFEQSTIAEIAQQADFSVGTIYNFFQSKKELFDAIIDSHVKFMSEMFQKIFASNVNPLEKIILLLHSMFDIFSEKMDILKFWFDTTGLPISSFHTSLSSGIVELKKLGTKQVADCFAEATKLGLIVDIEPQYLTIALDGIIYSFISAYVEEPENYPLGKILENVKKIFFQSIITSKGNLVLQQIQSLEGKPSF